MVLYIKTNLNVKSIWDLKVNSAAAAAITIVVNVFVSPSILFLKARTC